MKNDKTMSHAVGVDEATTFTFHPTTNYEDVLIMHNKFGLPQPIKPQLLSPDAFDFRLRFLQEELDEFVRSHEAGDLEGAADALIDLAYVTIGTAIFMGLPWQHLWNEVQVANLAKKRGTNAKRGSFQADLIKPEGWRGPDIAGVLREWADQIESES